MAREHRKGKKKVNKQPRAPTIVPPLTGTPESAPLPPGVAKLRPEQTVFASKEIFIAAPAGLCFDTLSKQLEQSPEWDPIVVNARPVSNVRGRIGATSQVTLNLGGKKLESLAMISQYRPNRVISWVISRKPKVKEDWQLERKLHGTQVYVTLAYELDGWVIRRFLYKIMSRKKVEQDVDKMLTQLKAAAESISHDQRAKESRS